ncbi:MAG: formylglycine-generating enzyme family protein [Planctomycetota bacterium]|nr:formylglycine-generating enzyme family protein [Planctomycetota bacterium]
MNRRTIALALATALLPLACRESPRPEKAEPPEQPTQPPAKTAPPPVAYVQAIPNTRAAIDLVPVPAAKVWLGKTEITWAQFETWYFTEEEEDLPDGVDAISRPSSYYFPHDRGWGRGKRPAVGFSRHAAEQFCVWLSQRTGRKYRLPTEAEWEAACGDAPADLDVAAWHEGNSGAKTQPVAGKSANAAGLHDMLGNVWEYCQGTFAQDDDGPVLRGGCWADPAAAVKPGARRTVPFSWNERDPQRPRSVWWYADGPYAGFRIARSFADAKETK